MMKRQFNSSKGFTLVEVSIVMIIIGLLIGGILKGQELVQNARIKATIQNINAYRSAILTFEDSYGGLPGDLNNPGQKLVGCTSSTGCVAAGGNQDGFIGTHAVGNWSHDDQSGLTTEPTQFWIQLNAAGLISGLSGNAQQEWGQAYPASPFGGGLQVLNTFETGANQATGHYFLLRLHPTGDPHPTAPGVEVLSPRMLARLDRQYDDGRPNTGTIIADDGAGLCWATGTTTYVESSDSKICLSAFKF